MSSYFSLFFCLNLLFIFLSLSSCSWMMVWFYMEMVVFFFIPMLYSCKSSLMSSMGLWKYFVFQSLSSLFFIIFILVEGWNYMTHLVDFFLIISVFLKMGLPPFHGWVFQICENLDWLKFFLINSIQKVIPLWILLNLGFSFFIIFFSLVSLIFCMFMSITVFSIRWMMMVSSSLNSVWMICSVTLSDWSSIWYMLNYFFVFFYILKSFNMNNIFSLNSLVDYKLKSFSSLVLSFLLFLFMIGIPPFGLFLGKLNVLSGLINNSWLFFSLFLIFVSGLMVVLYFNIFISYLVSLSGYSLVSSGKFSWGLNLSLGLLIFLFVFSFFG